MHSTSQQHDIGRQAHQEFAQQPAHDLGREPYTLFTPVKQHLPVVFNSPHSGSFFPDSFTEMLAVAPEDIRRQVEDLYVDELFSFAVDLGCPHLVATHSRAYVDLNRASQELDAEMISGHLPDHMIQPSLRTGAGFGLLLRRLNCGAALYPEALRLSLEHIATRLNHVYYPYHAALQGLIERTREAFGVCYLIDCHSMPAKLPRPHGTHMVQPADMVIGTRYGASCAPEFAEALEAALRDRSYITRQNHPYAGGHITAQYGRPDLGIHAIQLEINRRLYVEEGGLKKSSDFGVLQKNLESVFEVLTSRFRPQGSDGALTRL